MFLQSFGLVVLLLSQISSLSDAASNESLIESRIRLGDDAEIKDAAFVVSIRNSLPVLQHNPTVLCGGTLISLDVVLTAAHCFLRDRAKWRFGRIKDYEVVMGNLNRATIDGNTLKFKIRTAMGAGYIKTRENDIALLFLRGKVPENHPTVKPVILNSNSIEDLAMCKAYGWGNNGLDVYPEILQVADIVITTLETCRENTNYGDHLKEGMFCAGYFNFAPGMLDGDSGGPVVCNDVQFGINSFLQKTFHKGGPSVCTDVAKYEAWILKQIYLNGGTEPTFTDTSGTSIYH